MKTFFQSNTIRLCLAAILGAWGTYFGGQLTLKEAVFATVAALAGIFLRKGVTTPIVKAVLVMFLVCSLAACSSMPTGGGTGPALARDLSTPVEGPSSGQSSAETSTLEIPTAPAVAWGASTSNSNALSARYSPTQTNSASGSLVTGFVQGITAAQREELRQAIAAEVEQDPVLASLAAELAALAVSEVRDAAWQARIDAVRESYAAARERLLAGLAEAGVTEHLDLGSLTSLVVVGFVTTNVGATERPPTPEEAANLARVLANPISAARGETVILGKGETVEGGQ